MSEDKLTEADAIVTRLEFGPQTKAWLLSVLGDTEGSPFLERAMGMIAAYQANVQNQRASLMRLGGGESPDVQAELVKTGQELALRQVRCDQLAELIRSAVSGNVDPATAIATLKVATKALLTE